MFKNSINPFVLETNNVFKCKMLFKRNGIAHFFKHYDLELG
jgi:hypothetical protein